MSVFPKRTVRNGEIIIHWGFLPSDTGRHLLPKVRLAVIDPAGRETVLTDTHMMKLPTQERPRPGGSAGSLLPRTLPLHVLAGYLAEGSRRARLVDLLERSHDAVHHYYVHRVPEDAPLGRYEVIADVVAEGIESESGTRSEDHFFVEALAVDDVADSPEGTMVTLTNPSTEPVDFAMAGYVDETFEQEAHQLGPGETFSLTWPGRHPILVWSEGRNVEPLRATAERRVLRNQHYRSLRDRGNSEALFLMNPATGQSERLDGLRRALWVRADGIATRADLRTPGSETDYDALVATGLLVELPASK